jgi:hypothetical protein
VQGPGEAEGHVARVQHAAGGTCAGAARHGRHGPPQAGPGTTALAGCWLLAAGCWLLAAGCWLLAAAACPGRGAPPTLTVGSLCTTPVPEHGASSSTRSTLRSPSTCAPAAPRALSPLHTHTHLPQPPPPHTHRHAHVRRRASGAAAGSARHWGSRGPALCVQGYSRCCGRLTGFPPAGARCGGALDCCTAQGAKLRRSTGAGSHQCVGGRGVGGAGGPRGALGAASQLKPAGRAGRWRARCAHLGQLLPVVVAQHGVGDAHAVQVAADGLEAHLVELVGVDGACMARACARVYVCRRAGGGMQGGSCAARHTAGRVAAHRSAQVSRTAGSQARGRSAGRPPPPPLLPPSSPLPPTPLPQRPRPPVFFMSAAR